MHTKLLFLFIAWGISLPAFSKDKKNNAATDILSYDISLKVYPDKKFIEGSNLIQLKALKTLSKIELHLFPQMKVHSVLMNGQNIAFQRDSQSFQFLLPKSIKKGEQISFEVHFSGKPIEAKKAPWDGGFVWSKDSAGNAWVGLACEGLGASCWLPCKDGWDDEPEKVSVKLAVPAGLTGVSNGKFIGEKVRPDGFHEFVWRVVAPINHYNISVNIGKYIRIQDVYLDAQGERLSLDYYVLTYNAAKAKTHFQQVKRMLASMEYFFGPYPFYEDGYKLVETPYWGMEHQSCVAYGNNYVNNKFGFDFIIVHESGHEWFANSITAYDKSDMWIHEGFTTYSEALYVEKQYGSARALQYLAGQKPNIKNESPMVGPIGVNYNRTDNDNYYKGTWILHTMRSMLDNDTLWFNTLKDLNKTFYHKIVKGKEIEAFFCQRTGYNFQPFFEQYLYHKQLPVVEYYLKENNGLNQLFYRLVSETPSLQMPIRVSLTKGKFEYLVVDKKWRVMNVPYADVSEFKLDDKHFLLGIKQVNKP